MERIPTLKYNQQVCHNCLEATKEYFAICSNLTPHSAVRKTRLTEDINTLSGLISVENNCVTGFRGVQADGKTWKEDPKQPSTGQSMVVPLQHSCQ